jgi:superfamily II DNA or RNA helicase
MEITDAWLMEMGGWQEMKRARAMHAAGAVLRADFDGTRLTGTVYDLGKEFASGMVIRSRSDMDNLCTCFQARKTGSLCAHALAVGTAWVHRHEKKPAPAAASTAKAAVPPARADGQLTLLLPPTFMEALQRQKLSMAVEAHKPHAAHEPYKPHETDLPFLTWLGSLQQTSVPPHLMLSAAPQIAGLLAALAGHPRVFVKEGAQQVPLAISRSAARLPLVITEAGDNVRLALRLPAAAKASLPAAPKDTGWLFLPGSLKPIRLPEGFHELLRTLQPQRPLEKPRRWLAAHLEALQAAFTLDTEASSPGVLALKLRPALPQFELTLEGSLDKLSAKLRCRYDGGPVPFPPLVELAAGFPLAGAEADTFLTRNLPAEAAAVRRLEGCGFDAGSAPGEWILSRETLVLQFFAGELDRLKADWLVTMGTRFAAATANVDRVTPQWQPVGSGTDWLSFDLAFTSARGGTFDRAEIARILSSGGNRKLQNGRIAVVNMADAADLNEMLRDVQPDQNTGSFRVKRSQLGYLEQTFGKLPDFKDTAAPWPLDISVPTDLLTKLRDYQKTGVQWLLDHAAQRRGGILADEMGLGKTLQSLSLIAAARRQWPDQPALVVCPKSLLGNWRAEAAKFTPDLKVVTLEGARRKNQFAAIKDAHLVITSYQLLARDIDEHRAVEWGAVILDEAGFIRNPDTQAAKAARELRAAVRFALTGTPIENSVRDLWSLTEFAIPGYLGPRKDFAERYESPLSAGSNAQTMARLRRRMSPYILRRLKTDVAKDLPSKIEMTHACDMNPAQRELYAALMREGAAKVMDADNAKNKAQARLHMLTTLLRLRQTCCDPRLLPGGLAKPPDISGKMEALAELLEEIRDGGHSVLIFSAFATMLRLIEETVKSAGLDYCLLDGQTHDRQALVDSFQNDEAKHVFLISLKAGGYGLNLTKADTVIHFDPWWNPAVEAQATDRAHRIGQTRPVTVYKLITTGTVEEKIATLQAKKRGLMDAALDDEAPVMDGLTDDDLRALLSQ